MLGGLECSEEGGVETAEEAEYDADQEGGGIVGDFLPRSVEEATIGNGKRKEPNQDGHGGLGDGLYRLGKGREILGRLFSFAGR